MSDRKKVYNLWHNICIRCGNPKYPTYIDCSVCDEWKDFNTFYEWYLDSFYQIRDEKMCVDKDLLCKGNKLYSPKYCCIIPEFINMIITNRKRFRGDLPLGVTFKDGKYMAKCKMYGRDNYIGTYNTAKEAFANYKMVKEKYIQDVADEYKNSLPEKVYRALKNYKVNIND